MGEGVAPSEPIGEDPHGEQIVRHRIEIASKTLAAGSMAGYPQAQCRAS
jgi:hypothetical protein